MRVVRDGVTADGQNGRDDRRAIQYLNIVVSGVAVYVVACPLFSETLHVGRRLGARPGTKLFCALSSLGEVG